MAEPTWGPIVTGTYSARIGVEMVQSPAKVSATTSSVTVTARIWLWTQYRAMNDSVTVSWSGSFGSGSATVTANVGSHTAWSKSNRQVLRTVTRTVSPSFSSTTASSLSASVSGLAAVGNKTMRASGAITTGRRPVSAPAAPSSVVVSRGTDYRHAVSWKLPAHTASAPVTNIVVQRRVSGSTSFVTVATLGRASSWTDTSTVPGKTYQWRVYARNSGGRSTISPPSELVHTSPLAPKGVRAQRTGTDVRLTWTAPAGPATSYEIAYSPRSSGYTYPGWTTTGTSYTVSSPDPTEPLTYAVRARTPGMFGTLTSAWAHSNEVQLLTAPSSPTLLAPTAVEASDPVRLSWQHNPIDTTDQSAFEVRWRVKGTSGWTSTGRRASTRAWHTLDAGTWGTQEPMEWQVRTWGQHTGPSPWSSLKTTTVSERPSVTLTSPVEPAWPSSSVRIVWSFHDPEDSAQAAFRVRLLDVDGNELWSMRRPWLSRVVTPDYRLQDGMSYVVAVSAQDAAGLWSEEVTQQIDVTYAPPPPAHLVAERIPDVGAVAVSISHRDPTDGEVEAVECRLQRSIDGGPWHTVATGLPLEAGHVDPIPHTSRPTSYRVVTVSATPSEAESDTLILDPDPRGWIYLNAGPGWSQVVRMRDNATLTPKWERGAQLHHFAGHRRPTSIRSEHQTRSVAVSARLAPNPDGSATGAELEEFLATAEAPILYRDPKGRRWWVEITEVSGAEARNVEEASFTVTEIDFDEAMEPGEVVEDEW